MGGSDQNTACHKLSLRFYPGVTACTAVIHHKTGGPSKQLNNNGAVPSFPVLSCPFLSFHHSPGRPEQALLAADGHVNAAGRSKPAFLTREGSPAFTSLADDVDLCPSTKTLPKMLMACLTIIQDLEVTRGLESISHPPPTPEFRLG